jgi:hypothetical protein
VKGQREKGLPRAKTALAMIQGTGVSMYGRQTTLRMNKELYDKLEKTAREHMRSVSDMIRLILTENLEKYKRRR